MTTQNSVHLIGRIGNDTKADLKTLKGDTSLLEIRIAVDRSYKTSDGDKITDWINCKFWNKQAEILSEYTEKGDMVAVSGEMRIENWENDSGEKRSKAFVHGDGFRLLGSPSGEKKTKKAPKRQPEPEPEDFLDDDDDSLPPF